MIWNKKKISDNSAGIQADRDVTVNVGLTFSEVEKLTKLFLQENFPKLREDAMFQAQENISTFLNEFEKQLEEKFDKLNVNKFSDPDIQSSINDAVQESGKRGSDANISFLVDLILRKASQNVNDLQSLTISEAIKIVPRLSNSHISLLTIMFFFQEMHLKVCNDLREYDPTFAKLSTLLNDFVGFTAWNLQYLEHQSCLVFKSIGRGNAISILKSKHSNLQTAPDSILQQQVNQSAYVKDFVALHDKYNVGGTRLTIIGQMIAVINISKYLPNTLNVENFIK